MLHQRRMYKAAENTTPCKKGKANEQGACFSMDVQAVEQYKGKAFFSGKHLFLALFYGIFSNIFFSNFKFKNHGCSKPRTEHFSASR